MPENSPPALQALDEEVDHLRGPPAGHHIVEYGDYECPYSRRAFQEIRHVEHTLSSGICFAFRHFPLTHIHPHAFAAAAAAEAAALQDRFWDMHELLFDRQNALTDGDLHGYAAELALDVARFGCDLVGADVLGRIRRDVDSGTASEVRGTPTLFVDGVLHLGGYDAETLMRAVAR
jgi:protein-disulfide isomerase